MLNVGIVGGTGYTGVELMRLLSMHPEARIVAITSRAEEGVSVGDIFPSLRGHVDLTFEKPTLRTLTKCDIVFFATPHGVAMEQAQELVAAGVRVIDLAADFRLKDLSQWKKWYGPEHGAQRLLEESVYGLPELNREKIKTARVVGNPGCYATAVELGFAPLLASGLIDPGSLIADAKSGASGAGRKKELSIIYSEVGENFKAYGLDGHRHHPEIVEVLDGLTEGSVKLKFTPHLLPINRGILATLYANLTGGDSSVVRKSFETFFKDEPFVDLLPIGQFPDTRSVRGSNFCKIGLQISEDQNSVVVISVLDNLVKGASGQAIQNMNIMFSLDEKMGLNGLGLVP
ncbi:MAG: N-acetyl-gamma-glutamyl-phosphate reductase [Proteobacteria bacterium]|nr:N-acetyl-gamma-glutamyl-phosphate reductase [Pseudomonadota bacterium]MDA1332535.1 N-acetyl-gamma-glutamyl-phosphate reductase [Pseudomonadota bacterium]